MTKKFSTFEAAVKYMHQMKATGHSVEMKHSSGPRPFKVIVK